MEEDLIEDLAFGAVPILGDLTSILMDYDFIRRVDIRPAAFPGALAQGSGKLEEIHPAAVSQRRSSFEGGIDVASQLVYLGSFGIAFGVAFPVILIARGWPALITRRFGASSKAPGMPPATPIDSVFRLRSTMDAGSATASPSAELSVSAATRVTSQK